MDRFKSDRVESLLFLGDIASPNSECSADLFDSLRENPAVFKRKHVVANLEGLLSKSTISTLTPVLFNHPSVLEALKFINTRAVSLANNHTLDRPDNLPFTTDLLQSNQIESFGAGREISDAEKPASFLVNEKKFLVFGYCWHVMMQHQKNRPGRLFVNIINSKRIIENVIQARKDFPEAIIVLKMHWNFDLETLPFPMYRELSKDLIDAGANAVIGSHSHCIQGGERYKNGIIIYGLGNFFIPWHTFINGTIKFPEFAKKELALEWNPETNKITCHWFRYEIENNRHRLLHQGSEDFDQSKQMAEFSPYSNMNNQEYIKYFKKNRRKKFLLPVYESYHHSIRNRLIDSYLIYRIRFARMLSKLEIRDWNN